MLALIQRVREARVTVDTECLAAIGRGLLVFVGVEKGDTPREAERLAGRVTGYRVFPDADGKMNLSLTDVAGELLLVPQFTLPADTRKGMRPSLSPAAPPEEGERLFERFVEAARRAGLVPGVGRFGAQMQVHLVNDGPVTFMLQAPPPRAPARL